MVLVAGAGPAQAQSIHAAALVPQAKRGALTLELRDKLHEAVVRGLSSLAGPNGPSGELGEVGSATETRARLGEELLGCGGEASCRERAITALQVNRLVATELTVAGKSYAFSMRLYDGQGHEITHADDTCDICTVHEVEEALAKSAARLAAAARMFPVESVASSARPLPPPREEAPPVPPRQNPMAEGPPPTPPPRPSEHGHFPWRPVGFASFGAGLLGLAVGIPLLVIDGKPTCNAADATHACPQIYSTKAGGAAAVTLGTLGLVASIPLLYFDYRDRRGAMSSFHLGGGTLDGGGRITFEGRF